MMITLKKIKRLSLISPRSLRSHSSNSNDKEDESYDSPNYKILDPNLQKMDFFNRDSYQDRPYFLY